MKTDEIKWRILNDTAENVIAWIEEKDRRIAELEAQWQPIETAPKDGERIILSRIDYVHDTKGLDIDSNEWKEIVLNTEPTLLIIWWAIAGQWSKLYGAKNPCWHDGMDRLANPTHWMPLPEPPEES